MKTQYILFFILVLFYFGEGNLYALPEGGSVVAGEASIHLQDSQTLAVGQATDRAIINWDQFNIASNETVLFTQPGPDAVALNRVTGGDPSSILGRLSANGHLFLVNPEGIFFGPNATLNVGGLLATTLDIKDDDFLSGKTNFQETNSAGPLVNQGEIAVSDGGFVFLVAPSVSNAGIIRAPGGEIVLMTKGGSDILSSVINQSGIIEANSLVNQGGVIRLIASDPVENTGQLGWQTHLGEVTGATGNVMVGGTLNVAAAEPMAAAGEITVSGLEVTVSGNILAQGTSEGGRVLVTTSDKTVLTESALVDTSGVENADAGNIVIWSDGVTSFEGTLLAKGGAVGGDGGAMEVSGYERLGYWGAVNASVVHGAPGSLLLDPKDIIIENGGGDSLSANDLFGENQNQPARINAGQITNVTKTGTGVTLQANNDITVNEAIVTSNPNGKGGDLTLKAGRSILLNKDIISDDGSIILIANDSVAIGTQRDLDKRATVTMLAGTKLDAGASDGGLISITLDEGLVGGDDNTGDILLGSLITSSNIEVIHKRGGSVLQTSGATITANSAVFDFANGAIGAPNVPIKVHLNALEARSRAGGVSIESDQALIIGDSPLASPRGISGIDAFGPVSILAFGNLTVSEPIKAGGEITLIADQMDLNSNVFADRGSVISLQPRTQGRAIDLGSTGATGVALELSQAELNQITTTGLLQIGSSEAGAIFISAPINTVNVKSLALQTGGTIGQDGPITEENLRVKSGSSVELNHPSNDLNTIIAKVDSPGKTISVTDRDDIALVTAGDEKGIQTDNGAVTVIAQGDITVNGDIDAGTASISLTAGNAKDLTNNATISGTGIVLQADQMILATTSNIEGGAGRVTLQPVQDGRRIDLGTTNSPIDALGLSDRELDTIKTTGTLQIGGNKTGEIAISDPINTAAVTTLTLISKGPVAQTDPVVEENLRIESVKSVTLSDPKNDVASLTVNITGPGETFIFTDANVIGVGPVDGVTGVKTNGGEITINSRITFVEDIERGFQLGGSPIWLGVLNQPLLDILTKDFVVLPKSPCQLDPLLLEEVSFDINEGC
jgi:filamentous hemagglutinin family protein